MDFAALLSHWSLSFFVRDLDQSPYLQCCILYRHNAPHLISVFPGQLLIAPVAPLRRPNKKQMMKLAKERAAKEAAQRKRCVTLTNTSSTLCCAALAYVCAPKSCRAGMVDVECAF
jgi:hypothetical protein